MLIYGLSEEAGECQEAIFLAFSVHRTHATRIYKDGCRWQLNNITCTSHPHGSVMVRWGIRRAI